MNRQRWIVRLSGPARADVREILRWTAEHFGEAQASAYEAAIFAALDALRRGPSVVGVRARPDISRGIYTLHTSRYRRRARHIILFRLARERDGPIIVVGRILHEAMDLTLHLTPDQDE